MLIRINTERVREAGQRLIAEAQNLEEASGSLDGSIASLDTWAWDGVSRGRAEPLLSRARPDGDGLAQQLEELGRKLVRVADIFEHEDSTAAQNLAGMSWVDFAILRDALAAGGLAGALPGLDGLPGTGGDGVSQAEYEQMTWRERREKWKELQEEQRRAQEELDAHHQRMRDEGVPEDLTLDALDRRMESIDYNLESLRKALQSARDSRNTLGSLITGSRDDWDMEIQHLESQIAALESEREQLLGWRELLVQEQSLEAELDTAKENCTKFIGMVEADPTPFTEPAAHELVTPPPHPYGRPDKKDWDGYCLGYAEARRPDLDPNREFNHAFELIDSDTYKSQLFQPAEIPSGTDLRVSGIEPGMAIVWDAKYPDVRTSGETRTGYPIGNGSFAHASIGHVAIIEKVQPDGVWLSDDVGDPWFLSWSDVSQSEVSENTYIIP
jgi:uncharacterized protein YukE